MATGNNNVAAVSTTKGVAGGYAFSAASSATLPTDFSTALPEGFTCLGFVSEDGISETIDTESTTLNDLNGDPIYTATSRRTETVTLKLVEVNAPALKETYGQDMVAVAASGDLTVKHGDHSNANRIYVFELVLRDGRKWRQVIPAGQVTSVGDLSLAAGEIAGREITITCNIDQTGVSVYDYIEAVAS